MKVYKVQVNYKSGKSMEAWFEKFKVSTTGGEISIIESTVCADGPLFFGICNIESIWLLEEKEV